MGDIVAATIDLDIEDGQTAAGENVPGLGWTLSDESLRAIEAVEANIRTAEQMSGSALVA